MLEMLTKLINLGSVNLYYVMHDCCLLNIQIQIEHICCPDQTVVILSYRILVGDLNDTRFIKLEVVIWYCKLLI